MFNARARHRIVARIFETRHRLQRLHAVHDLAQLPRRVHHVDANQFVGVTRAQHLEVDQRGAIPLAGDLHVFARDFQRVGVDLHIGANRIQLALIVTDRRFFNGRTHPVQFIPEIVKIVVCDQLRDFTPHRAHTAADHCPAIRQHRRIFAGLHPVAVCQ